MFDNVKLTEERDGWFVSAADVARGRLVVWWV